MTDDATHAAGDQPRRIADPDQAATQAARRLTELTGAERHDVAVVLGSGWSPAADLLGGTTVELSGTDLPGFVPSTVAGHAGRIRSIHTADRRVLAFLGRTHYYEGDGASVVVHGVRTAVAAGCRTVVLTNGCGSLRAEWPPGTPVLIRDHLNLTATSPLVGAHFVDLTDLYSTRLREACHAVDPTLAEGVYAQLPGPHYETPAEIGYLRTIGADLVGMSTALEAIAARAAGAEVLGLSLVTNLAAGLGSGEPLDHAEVLAAGRAAAERMGALLARILTSI